MSWVAAVGSQTLPSHSSGEVAVAFDLWYPFCCFLRALRGTCEPQPGWRGWGSGPGWDLASGQRLEGLSKFHGQYWPLFSQTSQGKLFTLCPRALPGLHDSEGAGLLMWFLSFAEAPHKLPLRVGGQGWERCRPGRGRATISNRPRCWQRTAQGAWLFPRDASTCLVHGTKLFGQTLI